MTRALRHLPRPPPELVDFARELRTTFTDAESLMWHLLRARPFAGFKFRRQHPVRDYVLDFYCAEANLGIELDGGQHAEQVVQDSRRAEVLKVLGIEVVRHWNNDVIGNTGGVLEDLWGRLLARDTLSPGPSPSRGRGETR